MLKIKAYWNTIKYLKAIQVISRIQGKFKSKARLYFEQMPSINEVHLSIIETDLDSSFYERFRIDKMFEGEMCLLNKFVKLDYSYTYTHSIKPLIHNNVYYFEYAVAIGAYYRLSKDEKYVELFQKIYNDYLLSDANVKSSYIMALHIPNLLIAIDLFGEALDSSFKDKVYKELYSQYKYLEQHQETHLLANHYFEDLKTLVIAAYLFGEENKSLKYLKRLHKQCDEQILADGLHYELSPMYHKLILEGLLRVALIYPNESWLKDVVTKMTDAMVSLEKGMGRTPLFNDSGDNVAKSSNSLVMAVNRIFGYVPKEFNCFQTSGYYKLYDGSVALLVDAGKIGVDYQPAHGHSDCLSFEVSYDGVPLFVNLGTYEYQGEKRKLFKLTSAHNTIVIDSHEQNQCWEEFRVGARIKNVKGELNNNNFVGSYLNYYGEKHTREIILKKNVLNVLDSTDRGENIKSYLHLAPGFSFKNNKVLKGDKCIAIISAIRSVCSIVKDGYLCEYASEFGRLEKSTCLVFSWKADKEQHGYRIEFETR